MVKFVDFDEIRVMIVEFSVKNFRSIKELQTISFVATKLKSNQEKHPDVDKNNIAEVGGMRLLKTVGIYGANASGKSNVIKALQYFLFFVSQAPQPNSTFSGIVDPFLFDDDCLDQEVFFQIVLLINDKKYRYGFTIKNNNDKSGQSNRKYKIVSEWLFGVKEKNQGKYFTRNGLEINKESLPNGENIPALQHEHNLFLSHAASYDKGVCYDVHRKLGWKSMSTLLGSFSGYALRFIRRNEKDKLLNFLSAFNLNYVDIDVDENLKEFSIVELNTIPNEKINLTKLDNNGNRVKLNLVKNESDGTKKLFSLAGFIIEMFEMSKGNTILIIDEIDSNFHPSLLIKLIKMFNDPEINKSGAQLLFTSHDTNLLDPSIMRRDQFYFTEKDEQEATQLYSLADLRGIRNDADFAKQYLAGYYGAVPSLKDYSLEKESENG